MIYSYELLLAAEQEYKDSLIWYRKRSRVAAENFAAIIQNGISKICADPVRFKVPYKDYHELTLTKYPFCIVYKIDDKRHMVIIIAIYHQHRNPQNRYR